MYSKKLYTLIGFFMFFSFIASAQEADPTGTAAKASTNENKPASPFPEQIATECNKLKSQYTSQVKDFCTKTVTTKAKDCNENYIPASDICNPDTNPNIAQQTALIQTLLSSAQGLTESCSTFSKIMDIGKLAMTAYSTYCGAKRQICESSCASSIETINVLGKNTKTTIADIKKKCPTPRPEPETDLECPKANSDIPSLENIVTKTSEEVASTSPKIGGKLKACKIDMTALLTLGIANIGALAQSKSMSDQCNKQTASNDSKAADASASTTVDCALTANADKPICICKANPRLKGCEGVSTSLATNSTMSTGGSGSTSGKGLSGNIGNGTDAALNKQFPSDLAKTNKNDGTSSGSGMGGGSSAGLTGSTDSGTGSESQLAKNASAGNANILTTESGGGSGYRFGFGSSSGSKNPVRSVANSGGAKGKLSAMDWSNQVTSVAGKSNFDKIKTRYNENRTSLLAR